MPAKKQADAGGGEGTGPRAILDYSFSIMVFPFPFQGKERERSSGLRYFGLRLPSTPMMGCVSASLCRGACVMD